MSEHALSGVTANEPAKSAVSKLPIRRYLRLLEQSNLIEPERLAEFLREAQQTFGARVEDSDFLAERLVEARLLTLWQNQMLVEGQHESLLGGRHKGFFLGSYKLLSHLGTGGMNSVFLAEHTVMRRMVAIKVLPFRGEQDRRFLERFRLESRAIASLDHPNIVRAHDFNNDSSVYYLVMEYIEGKDLHHYVKERGPLPFRLAADYVRQAAEGLAHAHRAGLVHRDVKPANLLVDRKKTVKLLDLGIARLDREPDAGLSSDGHHQILGTADYLAPEQAINSHDVDFRADIYSLGCTLYFLLTGHPPFCKGTIAQRMLAHQMQEPPSIFEDRPQAPPGLVEICQRMMAKKPEDRFRSAEEVSEALAAWEQRYQQSSDDTSETPNGPVTVSETFAGDLGGTTMGRTKRIKKKRGTQRFRADELIQCRTCGTQFGRYMYRMKCPKCGTVNHPLAGGDYAEPEQPPEEETSSLQEAPLVPPPSDPNIKATCPSCLATFTARWSKCLSCGAATVLHDPPPTSSVVSRSSGYGYSHESWDQDDPSESIHQPAAEVETSDLSEASSRTMVLLKGSRSLRSQVVVNEDLDRSVPDPDAEAETSSEYDSTDQSLPVATPRSQGTLRLTAKLLAVVTVLAGVGLTVTLSVGDQVPVAEYHDSGFKKLEGRSLDGQRVGTWNAWFEQGQLQWQGEYHNGLKQGVWTYFNSYGQTVSEGSYEADKQHGAWMFRYSDGQLRSQGEYNQGSETGPWTFWHPTGHAALRGEFRDGQPVGTWTQWDESGQSLGTCSASDVSERLAAIATASPAENIEVSQ